MIICPGSSGSSLGRSSGSSLGGSSDSGPLGGSGGSGGRSLGGSGCRGRCLGRPFRCLRDQQTLQLDVLLGCRLTCGRRAAVVQHPRVGPPRQQLKGNLMPAPGRSQMQRRVAEGGGGGYISTFQQERPHQRQTQLLRRQVKGREAHRSSCMNRCAVVEEEADDPFVGSMNPTMQSVVPVAARDGVHRRARVEESGHSTTLSNMGR